MKKKIDKKTAYKLTAVLVLGLFAVLLVLPTAFGAQNWQESGGDINDNGSYYIDIDADNSDVGGLHDEMFAVTKHGGSSVGTGLLVVQEDGDVGIGTTDPQDPLHVIENSGDGTTIRVEGGTDAVNPNIYFIEDGGANANIRLYEGNGDALEFQTGGSTRLTLEQDGDVVIGMGDVTMDGDFLTTCHKSHDIGTSLICWDDVYADDFRNQGAPDWSDYNVLEKMKLNQPGPKPIGSFDDMKIELGRAELDPGTLPLELTDYYNLKYDYEHGLSDINPDDLTSQELGLTINSMASWNYQAIYDLIQEFDDLKEENKNLRERIEVLENE